MATIIMILLVLIVTGNDKIHKNICRDCCELREVSTYFLDKTYSKKFPKEVPSST